MADKSREIYVSSNGDMWLLVTEGDQPLVRHIPNPASGGSSNDTEVDAFLLANRNSPQGQALMKMREQP